MKAIVLGQHTLVSLLSNVNLVGRLLTFIKREDSAVNIAAVQVFATAIECADDHCLRKLLQRFNVMRALFNALNLKRKPEFYLAILHALWVLHRRQFSQACLEP